MSSKGYESKGDMILFIHQDDKTAESVYVVGNFMGWEDEHEEWEMDYDDKKDRWELEVDKEKVEGADVGFYEFTFIVDGEWLDADKTSDNVIHCPGYGYRYKITELE